MKRCKTLFTEGYGYQTFYKIEDVAETLHTRDDDLFSINLFVMADSDAHILLSTSKKISDDTPIYEIGSLILMNNEKYSVEK